MMAHYIWSAANSDWEAPDINLQRYFRRSRRPESDRPTQKPPDRRQPEPGHVGGHVGVSPSFAAVGELRTGKRRLTSIPTGIQACPLLPKPGIGFETANEFRQQLEAVL
jgi:hypothetical protein